MPHHLTPHDVVPSLRGDLNLNRPPIGAGAEVIKIIPGETDTPYTMRGFEFSIARMLDGKRTAQDVIANCERIGLPLDLGALEGLVQQLKVHGLIADRQHPGVTADLPLPRARAAWSPEIREHYRTALRLAREGDLHAAHRKVVALLALAPSTFEAIALKRWLDGQREAHDLGIPFRALLDAAEDAWRAEPIPEDAVTERVQTPPRFRIGPMRKLLPWALGAVAVAAIAVAVFVPLPRIAQASARLTPISESVVTPSHEGVIREVLVTNGEAVEPGETLVTFDSDDLERRIAQSWDALDAERRPLLEALGRTPQGKAPWAALRREEDAVARTQSALLAAQKESAGMKFDEGMRAVEEAFAGAQYRRDEALRALEALLPPNTTDTMQIEGKELEIMALDHQLRAPELLAPKAGRVKDLNAWPGQRVASDTQLLKLADTSQVAVVATVTPRVARLAKVGDPITLEIDGRAYPTVIDKVADFELTARVSNQHGQLRTGTSAVNLKFRPRALWQTF